MRVKNLTRVASFACKERFMNFYLQKPVIHAIWQSFFAKKNEESAPGVLQLSGLPHFCSKICRLVVTFWLTFINQFLCNT